MTIRDLRNRSADVLARVAQGESLTVTKDGAPDGAPVATVSPAPRAPLTAQELVRRRAHLPVMDAQRLRADLDEVLEPTL